MEEPAGTPTGSARDDTVAALCYIPFFFINWVAILYVLLLKKDKSRYEKFHALQALAFFFLLGVAGSLLAVLGMLVYFALLSAGIFLPAAASSSSAGVSSIFAVFTAVWGGSFIIIGISSLASIAIMVYSLYLAYMAYSGRDPKIPFIGKRVEGMV